MDKAELLKQIKEYILQNTYDMVSFEEADNAVLDGTRLNQATPCMKSYYFLDFIQEVLK